MSEVQAAPGGEELGPIARLTGVLFSPGKTFAAIARKPGNDWFIPVVILMALALMAGIFINPKLDTDAAVKDTMKKIEARGDIPDATKQQIEERVEKQFAAVKSGWVRFLGPGFVLVVILLVPLIYLGAAKALGGASGYKPLLAGYAYCQVPQILKTLIGIGVALPRESIDLNDAERLVKSSVGAFLDPETTSKPLLALLTSVDLFEIWGLVLGSIMVARSTRLSKNQATAVVLVIWVLWVLVKVFGAALGSAFGG